MKTLCTVVFLLLATTATAEVCLRWDPVPGADGYKVYTGATEGVYSASVDIGQEPSGVCMEELGKLCAPAWYAVTSYNMAGESGKSPGLYGLGRPNPQTVTYNAAGMILITGDNFDPDGIEVRVGTANLCEGADNGEDYFDCTEMVEHTRPPGEECGVIQLESFPGSVVMVTNLVDRTYGVLLVQLQAPNNVRFGKTVDP